jgi:hypothetical protein
VEEGKEWQMANIKCQMVNVKINGLMSGNWKVTLIAESALPTKNH